MKAKKILYKCTSSYVYYYYNLHYQLASESSVTNLYTPTNMYTQPPCHTGMGVGYIVVYSLLTSTQHSEHRRLLISDCY